MIDHITSFGQKVVAAEALVEQYNFCIFILSLFSLVIYERYIKPESKEYPMCCGCDPTNIFGQMETYAEHKPNPCDAGKICISNALFKLIESINRATESIVIAMPEFTAPELIKCISSAAARFVDIQIILNTSAGFECSPHIKEFLDGKTLEFSLVNWKEINLSITFIFTDIDVRIADRPITGAFCIIDPGLDSDKVINSPTWTHAVS